MYDEEELLPISALSHLAYCERRCALIHIEGAWDENVYTAEGRELHQRAHEVESATRAGARLCRGLYLRSLRLGLSGRADVVELHPCDDAAAPGVPFEGLPGRWQPYPVEYKRGRPKPDIGDEVQLCAQALCLEEMLDVAVPMGAIFYGLPRRRLEVAFTPQLRQQTERLALYLHDFLAAGVTPPPRHDQRCRGCSMTSLCLPKAAGGERSARRYLEQAIAEQMREEDSR